MEFESEHNQTLTTKWGIKKKKKKHSSTYSSSRVQPEGHGLFSTGDGLGEDMAWESCEILSLMLYTKMLIFICSTRKI